MRWQLNGSVNESGSLRPVPLSTGFYQVPIHLINVALSGSVGVIDLADLAFQARRGNRIEQFSSPRKCPAVKIICLRYVILYWLMYLRTRYRSEDRLMHRNTCLHANVFNKWHSSLSQHFTLHARRLDISFRWFGTWFVCVYETVQSQRKFLKYWLTIPTSRVSRRITIGPSHAGSVVSAAHINQCYKADRFAPLLPVAVDTCRRVCTAAFETFLIWSAWKKWDKNV